MGKVIYEATKWNDGTIMDLYRKTEDGSYEEFIPRKGWESSSDAFDAFNGLIHSYGISDEEAEEYVNRLS